MRKYFWQREWNHELSDVARSIRESNKTLADSIIEANKNDVKARDRVDITLEEYERLKEENRLLHEEVTRLRKILTDIRIPVNIWERIKLDTIKTSVCHDIREFVDRFRIEFDVDVPYSMGKDYEY
jgi:phage tail tape-measure protein